MFLFYNLKRYVKMVVADLDTFLKAYKIKSILSECALNSFKMFYYVVV